jgi:hypothetical protein
MLLPHCACCLCRAALCCAVPCCAYTCSDMEKLRLKPRNFQFAPVKGWLGGDLTEKVEGWKCTVYEAAGKVGGAGGTDSLCWGCFQ